MNAPKHPRRGKLGHTTMPRKGEQGKRKHGKSLTKKPVDLDDIDPEYVARRPHRLPANPGGRPRTSWEPTGWHWMIYDMAVKGATYRQISAKTAEQGQPITFQRVGVICQTMDRWIADYYWEDVREIRTRHTRQLEHIFSEAMSAWEKSKEPGVTEEFESVEVKSLDMLGNETSEPGTKTKRKVVYQCGAPAFLGEARSALADIRKIHGADKNPKVREENEGDDQDRVAGKPRVAVIDEHIQRLISAREAAVAAGVGSGGIVEAVKTAGNTDQAT